MAIYLGYPVEDKQAVVAEYCRAHDVGHVVVIAPPRFSLPVDGSDQVAYADVIMYVTFYRLLQEIDTRTLLVINECLRTQNRYDLAYNCIRNYLNHTPHVLVFQALPQVDTAEDFMILFDFATGSRWKRRHFEADLIRDNAEVHVRPYALDFRRIDVPTTAATKRRYEEERERRFAELGARDPHTLPRNLYLIGGRDKLACLDARASVQPSLFGDVPAGAPRCVARNRRLGHEAIVTYDDVRPEDMPYIVVELPHRFIDWCDFVACTGQACSDVLVADLKVDRWYFERYLAWKERVCETYASLRP